MKQRQRSGIWSQEGFTFAYIAATMTLLLLFTGLAVDSGRAYVVKINLSKAVDGAALAAARNLNTGGNPRDEAVRVFKANFPQGYMGTLASIDPTAAADFFSQQVNAQTGTNIVNVKATTVMATSFMRLGNIDTVTVTAAGEATRRMVDLSLAVDVSGSIGSKWATVAAAVRDFINGFDALHDRLALMTFSNGVTMRDQMPSSRGFNKSKLISDVPNTLPGGVTSMAEAVYRAWDELRTVQTGEQSGLRVIVVFTDGSPNTVPGLFDTSGQSKGVFTSDFPKQSPDPDGITTNNPSLQGLYQQQTGVRSPTDSRSVTMSGPPWSNTQTMASVPYLPVKTYHQVQRSSGIPAQFDLQSSLVTVDGAPQNTRRGLRNFNATVGKYPADAYNINNTARNLVELIGNEARNDTTGDYKIRIYTIGMGNLLKLNLGTRLEKGEDILKRLANDKTSADYNSTQLTGKYFYAATEADVGPAFQQLQNEIIRLTK
jgi:Mg-chelatase subunit ChlD